MNDSEQQESFVWGIRSRIEMLIAHFAWLIDHEDGHRVADLFTTHGCYSLSTGGLALKGRSEIAEFYAHRRARGPRTSRHLFSNLHLTYVDENRAQGTCVLTLHAADGDPPRPLSPVMIADYADSYCRDDDGIWRFESRTVTTLFGDIPILDTRRP